MTLYDPDGRLISWSAPGGTPRNAPRPRTLADWTEALAASGWEGRKVGREHVGPCPCCAGTDRFHVAAGRRVEVVAGCRGGCTFEALAEAVFGPQERRRGPRPPDWTRSAPKPAGSPQKAPGGDSGRSGGIPEATESPRTQKLGATHTPGRGKSGPSKAAGLWARSVPVPLDPAHPARKWAARRNLWPADRDWPEAVRWIEAPAPPGVKPSGGSLVAAFGPVGAWTQWTDGRAALVGLTGVQLVHVDATGRPRTDGGGLAKRSHGDMTGAVCAVALHPGPVHVAEGLADALAIAARCDGAVIAAGGTSALARLARPLAGLARPVVLWPDGDTPGRTAARKLAAALRTRGAVAVVVEIPDGEDPASVAAPIPLQPARNGKPARNRGSRIAPDGLSRGDPTYGTPLNPAPEAPNPCAIRAPETNRGGP